MEWYILHPEGLTIGPNTVEAIKRILSSPKLEVQTYRMCQGVLSFTRKYSKQALEETCRQALELGKVKITPLLKTRCRSLQKNWELPVTIPA